MTPETFDKDYYAVLGVRRSATAEQIKHAFRSKAKLLHPDRNRSADATDEFIRLGEAYRVLRDEEQRQVFDAFWANVAPPPMHRRPAWRAAAVMVALVASIGAAATFGYLALQGGPSVLVADSAPAKSAAVASPTPTPPLIPQAGEEPAPDLIQGGLRVGGGHTRDDAAEGNLRHMQSSAASPLIRSLPAQGPPRIKSGAGSSPASGRRIAPLETDENLVASLSESVDAPFEVPEAASIATATRPTQLHVSVGAKAQKAAAVPPQRIDHRLAQQVSATPKPAAVAPVAPHKLVTRPIVRTYAHPLYPVRVVRPPYRFAAYPPYQRAYVRRTAVRRYQAPRWAARPALADDWPF